MTALFLRNCNSKREYLIFKERYPEYLDTYAYEVFKTIKLTSDQINQLEQNTQTVEIWKNIVFTDFTFEANFAKCILVLNQQNIKHALVFFNGYKYAKYIAFI